MKFAYDFSTFPYFLFAAGGIALVIAFALVLVGSSALRLRAERLFGETSLVETLFTFNATSRRAFKGVLLVLAMLFSFIALSRPQYGKGTRVIPATNLDVVVVLDYSKSMYARDITPSRITRAKAEVGHLIRELGGARFGAVAFAGEPLGFPLTSDGAAISQFFRQLEPNDMPIGGTATARALERARELFARDPLSKDHVRVIVLITDGEDLEGDPLKVAEACAQEGTRVDVVQIGGRAPEPIPEVSADGKVTGMRRDELGKPLLTELSADGEAQLAKIAEIAHGTIVRAEKGTTGIETITRELSKMMHEELSERVETIFADIFAWPLGIAVALFMLEAAVGESPKMQRPILAPPVRKRRLARRERENA